MRKDYHMHPTAVLNPAKFDLFAQTAIARGVQEVCITDHMPLSTSNAGDRIPAGRVKEYVETVRAIREKYAGQLNVRLGIEIDYHPDFTDEIEAVLKAGQYDFVIGASHLHVGQCDIFHMVSTWNEYAAAVLKNTLLAAQSGYFDAVAHLDMYRWIFTLPKRFPIAQDDYSPARHEQAINDILTVVKNEGIHLEINPHLAVIENRLESTYPERSIVEMALEKDVLFSYGSDAHAAEHVGAMLDELEQHPIYGKALAKWEAE